MFHRPKKCSAFSRCTSEVNCSATTTATPLSFYAATWLSGPRIYSILIAIIFIASTITEICCEMQGDLFAQLCNRAAPEGQSLWVWSSGPRNGSSGSQPISVSLSNSFCVFCQLIRKSQISLLVRSESQKIRPTEEEVILLEMASVWLSAVHNLKWIEMSPCHALTRLVSLLLTISYSIIYNHHQLLN